LPAMPRPPFLPMIASTHQPTRRKESPRVATHNILRSQATLVRRR
jgi:hypothetical protein